MAQWRNQFVPSNQGNEAISWSKSSRLACIASISMGQRVKNGVFHVSPAQKHGARAKIRRWGGRKETFLLSPSLTLHFLHSPHTLRGQNLFARRSRWIPGFSVPEKCTGTLAMQAPSPLP